MTTNKNHYILIQPKQFSFTTKGNDMNIIENIYTNIYSYEYYECSLVSEGIGGAWLQLTKTLETYFM